MSFSFTLDEFFRYFKHHLLLPSLSFFLSLKFFRVFSLSSILLFSFNILNLFNELDIFCNMNKNVRLITQIARKIFVLLPSSFFLRHIVWYKWLNYTEVLAWLQLKRVYVLFYHWSETCWTIHGYNLLILIKNILILILIFKKISY